MLPFYDKLSLKLQILFPILPWKEVASTNRMKEDFNRDPRVAKLDDITPAKVFSFYPTQVWPLHLSCQSVAKCSCWVELSCYKLFFVKFVTWISLSYYMDLAKLIHGMLQLSKLFLPFAKQKKVDKDFKACWSICFDLKVVNESMYPMPSVRCAVGNV